MNQKPRILGLGAVCKDWVSVVDHFPEPDEKVDGISESYFPGGVTANYVTAVARLGAPCAFIGAVGDDDTGEFLIQDMQNEGITTSYCIKKKKMKSGVNFILVNKHDGQKMIIQSPFFTSTQLKPHDLHPEWFQDADLLHTTAIHHDLTIKAIEYAKKCNLRISLDLESQIAIRGYKTLKPILENVDILLPNKLGAMSLTKTDDPIDAAKKFNEMGIDIVVVTLGDSGAVAVKEGNVIKSDAFSIDAVDATGAGDTFCGAFTFSLIIKKWNLKKCLKFANAAAAIKMKKLGARTGMPSYNEVIDFLNNHGHNNYK